MVKKIQNSPDAIEYNFAQSLKALVKAIYKEWRPLLTDFVQWKQGFRLDGWMDDLKAKITSTKAKTYFILATFLSNLKLFWRQLSSFNRKQFADVFKAQTGRELPPMLERFEPTVARTFEERATLDVQRVVQTMESSLESGLRSGVTGQMSQSDMMAVMNQALQRGMKSMPYIARNEIVNADALLTEKRAQMVELNQYIWRTKLDPRVRDSHRAREGQKYSFSQSPKPGQEPNCRCRAELVFSKSLVV